MSFLYVQSSGFLFLRAQRAAFPQAGSAREPVIAIVFAAMSVEAWINELLQTVHASDADAPAAIVRLRAFSGPGDLRGPQNRLTTKVRAIAIALSEIVSEEDEKLYDDLELLVACRNKLVHQRPERIEYSNPRRVLDDLTRRLIIRGLVEAESETVQTLINSLCQSKVGEWACQTGKDVMPHIALRLPEGSLRRQQLYRPPLLENPGIDRSDKNSTQPVV
jgi:hypothetical protein